MEEHEVALIEQLTAQDPRLAKLWQEHLSFEQRLEEFNRQRYLTPEEEMERKRLQKLKLAGRDEIEAILASYRAKSQGTQGAGS